MRSWRVATATLEIRIVRAARRKLRIFLPLHALHSDEASAKSSERLLRWQLVQVWHEVHRRNQFRESLVFDAQVHCAAGDICFSNVLWHIPHSLRLDRAAHVLQRRLSGTMD